MLVMDGTCMKEKWVVAAKKADFNALGKKFGIDPVIARLIRNRDIIGEEQMQLYLHGTLSDIPDPHLLADADRAAVILKEKIAAGARIRIIGDYDIDGVTATYVLIRCLTSLGARADTYIPDRVLDGYGIHDHLVQRAIEDGIDTILTCDNGIAASSEIRKAKEAGLTVIVTDHHEVPVEEKDGERICILPPADAVVNPRRPDCPYPNKNICGAVVAWKVMQVLYDVMGKDPEVLWSLVDIAAIATVGDVMDLVDENRIIVREGLKKLQQTENVGLRALIRACGLQDGPISAYHIGFILGPCINASGRIDTAARSLALLCAEDRQEAERIAGELTDLNESRKSMTEAGKEEAVRLVEEGSLKEDRVLVVYLPDCHESIAGIIAGRLREKYYRPVFVLTPGENGVKGSGRSIEAYSMYEEMSKCADLLEQFGGHPMAAGLSMKRSNVVRFRKRLNENCTLTEDQLTPKVTIDVPMPVSYVTRPLVDQLHLLEPFGKANPKPVFAQKNLSCRNMRIVGKNRSVVRMTAEDENGYQIEAVYFGDAEAFIERAAASPIHVIYYPEINRWQGLEKLQITITNYL